MKADETVVSGEFLEGLCEGKRGTPRLKGRQLQSKQSPVSHPPDHAPGSVHGRERALL